MVYDHYADLKPIECKLSSRLTANHRAIVEYLEDSAGDVYELEADEDVAYAAAVQVSKVRDP